MTPVLSFIVPVRNDAERLRRCLDTIRVSTTAIASEVIVADNGSTDGSIDVARAAGAQVLAMPESRVSDMRNSAARAAGSQLLAFVDADHELDPGWSAAALHILADPAIVAVGAPYYAPQDGTWVQRMYDRFRIHEPGHRQVDWLPSGNLVVRRAAFEQVGGFDSSLETCEDVDLCQRLRQNGGQVLAASDMRSVHRGDPQTLKALFLGELWRGRDNLRVSFRTPLTFRSLPSVAVPIASLLGLATFSVGVITWPLGGWPLAVAGIGMLAALIGARAVWLLSHPGEPEPRVRLALQAILVAGAYETARALAIVARTGHDVRRKS